MEEILSSIKRIIAEDDGPAGRARKATVRPARLAANAAAAPAADPPVELSPPDPEILELTEAMPIDPAPADELAPAAAPPVAAPSVAAPPAASPHVADEIISTEAASASREALANLARMKIRPDEDVPSNSVEGLVREMLRPMLKDWLDANLPRIVERAVAKEVARIAKDAI